MGNFQNSELQKVYKDEDSLWYIERQIRKRKRNNKIEWLCTFEGWSSKFDQWISEEDIIE